MCLQNEFVSFDTTAQGSEHLRCVQVVLCKTKRCMQLMRAYREQYRLLFRKNKASLGVLDGTGPYLLTYALEHWSSSWNK